MTGYYARNPHYAPDDFSEEVARLERCEQEAASWFAELTAPQLAIYNETMSAAAAYKCTPKWERERAAAEYIWKQTTIRAREIYEMALRDLMLTGEVSEATSYAFDEVKIGQIMLEAAE